MKKLLISILAFTVMLGGVASAAIFGSKKIILFNECYDLPKYNNYKTYKNSTDNDFDEWSLEINLKKNIVTRAVIWTDKFIAAMQSRGTNLRKGAIDIDENESIFVDSVAQMIYYNKYSLNNIRSYAFSIPSPSGELYLYQFLKEPFSGESMRNGLAYFRDQLKLNSKIEIVTFPIISSNTLFVVAQVGAWEYTFDIKNKTIQTFHTKYKNTGKKKCNID
jgi:hypothetical protein